MERNVPQSICRRATRGVLLLKASPSGMSGGGEYELSFPSSLEDTMYANTMLLCCARSSGLGCQERVAG